MKRRKFIQYGALSGSAFLANSGLFAKAMPAPNKQSYKWILLYWMPYDNDLSRYGEPILQMLDRGVQSENILVVVQSDFWRAKNLSRSVIFKDRVEVEQLETVNSASEEVFAEYLSWANSQFVADKWAIAILGHGGHLDEISPDTNSRLDSESKTQWMNIQKINDVILNFNRQINSRVELFFFQNCNKGTIEAHYTLREAAKYTLSSQKLLGAPNYYYESMLQFLGQHPEINGGQLADKIIDFERSNMYFSYTVTENRYVGNLPAKLNPLIDEIIASNLKIVQPMALKTYSYEGENFVDVIWFFEIFAKRSVSVQKRFDEFVDFLKNSTIYRYRQNPDRLNLELSSGLGIFLPGSKQELEKYRYLSVFSHLKLVELFEAVLFDEKVSDRFLGRICKQARGEFTSKQGMG